ncbi:MAG TPA: methyltransferase domain-containing protein [Rhodocyclaceae bacterium]|nr:methyltransferase domain-containing protein [Rhodocyclaceae bacterium]
MSNELQPAEIEAILLRISEEIAADSGPSSSEHPDVAEGFPQPGIPLASLHGRQPITYQSAPSLPRGGPCDLASLLQHHDSQFIVLAYEVLLGRTPDSAGYQHYLAELREGAAKVDLLGRLRYSVEGRKHGCTVPGLWRAWALQRLYRIPLLGRIVRILSLIWHLPDLERSQRAQECQRIAIAERDEAHSQARDEELRNQLNVTILAAHELQGLISRMSGRLARKSEKSAMSQIIAAVLALDSELQQAGKRLGAELAMRASRDDLEVLSSHLESNRTALEVLAAGLRQSTEELGAGLSKCAGREELVSLSSILMEKPDRTELESLHALATGLQQSAEQFGAVFMEQLQQKVDAGELARIATADSERGRALESGLADLKLNVLDQERRLRLLLEEARKRLPAPISQEQIVAMVDEEQHLLDAFYVAFEDQFRGTREDIKNRVRVYLPVLHDAQIGSADTPVLDIGCGRGEWLELLHDEGLVGRGLDLNRVMIAQCREAGFDVTEGDAIDYLRSLPSNSLGAVTGFHIIEHLPFSRLVTLFDESLRVLRPGGIVIFETPNPENILVGSCNFYYDPTHLNPLPPEMIRFVVEARGFVRTKILRLHPHPIPDGVDRSNPLIERMGWAQDYSIIARKA